MAAFALIEGTILLLLAAALLTHVATRFVTEMMDRAARRAERERTPRSMLQEPAVESRGDDDTEIDDYEPDESWLHLPVLVGPRRDPLRL